MDVFECMSTRRSIRKFDPKKHLEWEKVGAIIEAGMMAPSSGNLQNWKFVVIEGGSQKKAIAHACMEQYWMEKASYYIVVVGHTDRARRFYGLRGERLYTVQNCAACVQNMLLAAHALGVGACWIGAFDEAEVAKIMNGPSYGRVQAVIPIGYAAEVPKEPLKKFDLYNDVFFDYHSKKTKDSLYSEGHFGELRKQKMMRGFNKFKKKIDEKVPEVKEKAKTQSKSVFDKLKEKIDERKNKRESKL